MSVRFRSQNAGANFNVSAPGRDTALFMGMAQGQDFSGVLPATGTYVVQQSDVDAGTIDNTASVASTQVTTPVTDSVSTPIAAAPAATGSKPAMEDGVAAAAHKKPGKHGKQDKHETKEDEP